MISLLVETHAFLDCNLEIYTLQLMPKHGLYHHKDEELPLAMHCMQLDLWEILFGQTLFGRFQLYWEGCKLYWEVCQIYWEGCQTLLVNLLGSLANFIGKVAKLYWEGFTIYWEGCQHLWV